METIEYFSDFLRKIGTLNFLAIGTVIMVMWLLISGLKRGLGKKGKDKDINDEDEQNGVE
jgi:hypothetical protein